MWECIPFPFAETFYLSRYITEASSVGSPAFYTASALKPMNQAEITRTNSWEPRGELTLMLFAGEVFFGQSHRRIDKPDKGE
jgi:hypothetical protein